MFSLTHGVIEAATAYLPSSVTGAATAYLPSMNQVDYLEIEIGIMDSNIKYNNLIVTLKT